MGVRTELEIRLIFDVTRTLSAEERDMLLDVLAKLKVMRHRKLNGRGIDDLLEIERALHAMTDAPPLAIGSGTP